MSRDQIVSSAKASLLAAQDSALVASLGQVYDLAAQEQKASDGTLTQGDLDAAVKKATDPLMQQISDLTAKDASDLKAGSDALAALQGEFDKMSADKKVEDGVIAGLQSAKDQLAAVLASLSSIGVSVPAPAPAPAPSPAPAPVKP